MTHWCCHGNLHLRSAETQTFRIIPEIIPDAVTHHLPGLDDIITSNRDLV